MALRLPFTALVTDAMAADDDRALVKRFAESRDESAFAIVVGRHAKMVYGVCRRAVRDAHLAEDAFQAVFLVLAKDPGRAVRSSAIGGWLFGIARRVGMAARRREERYARRQANQERERRSEPPDFDDLLRVLDEELAALADEFRAPLVACFLEERTLDEAARHLGWSVSTLRRRLDRAKELLRARLTHRGATLAGGMFAGFLATSAQARVPAALLDSVAPGASPTPVAATLASEVCRGGSFALMAGLAAVAIVALGLGGLAMSVGVTLDTGGLTPPARQEQIAPAPRADDAKWVTVRGRVVFPEKREMPLPRAVDPLGIKDVEFFGRTVFYQDVRIDPKTRGLANAFVWLRPDSDDRNAAFPASAIHPALAAAKPVDRGVQLTRDGFSPRVTAARAGDRIVFTNPNGIAFNVHYQRHAQPVNPMAADSGEFNVLIPSGGSYATKPLPAVRIADSFTDHIHFWFDGRAWVFDHPYFAVTDSTGNFEIANAPPGKWRVVVWHEKAGYRFGSKGRLGEVVAIADGEMKPLAFVSENWSEPE